MPDEDEKPPPQKFYGSNWGEIQQRMKSLRLAIDRVTASGIDLEIPPIPEGSSEFETAAVIQTFIFPLDDFIYFRNTDIEGNPDDVGRWSRGSTTRAEGGEGGGRPSEENPGEDKGFPVHTEVVGLPVLLRMQPLDPSDPQTYWVGNGEGHFYLAETSIWQFVARFAIYATQLHQWFLDASAIIEGASSSVTGLDEVKEEFEVLRDEWSKVRKWKSHGGKK
jgi:hypothetical protein